MGLEISVILTIAEVVSLGAASKGVITSLCRIFIALLAIITVIAFNAIHICSFQKLVSEGVWVTYQVSSSRGPVIAGRNVANSNRPTSALEDMTGSSQYLRCVHPKWLQWNGSLVSRQSGCRHLQGVPSTNNVLVVSRNYSAFTLTHFWQFGNDSATWIQARYLYSEQEYLFFWFSVQPFLCWTFSSSCAAPLEKTQRWYLKQGILDCACGKTNLP